jgi:hypothetical protein
VERWVQESDDGTIGAESLTPTSSVGFTVLEGNGARW